MNFQETGFKIKVTCNVHKVIVLAKLMKMAKLAKFITISWKFTSLVTKDLNFGMSGQQKNNCSRRFKG